ncbi:MAG: hypothetical protein JXR51_01445 [Bacteroidales bacterium]|nr:hypothetical protein [Bacteroidales bacterium]MBN2755809.1 hypothetical protein [Bacteroidales bacterium]
MKKLFIFCLFTTFSSASFAQIVKIPYLIYTGNPETMKIMFQTESPQIYNISYGFTEEYEIGVAKISQQKKGENENIFEYNFKYLKPNSKYFYKISNKTEEYKGYFYSAKEKKDRKVYFLVSGNNFSTNNKESAKTSVKKFIVENPKYNSVFLHTGNILKDENNEKCWNKLLSKKGNLLDKNIFSNIPIILAKSEKKTSKPDLFRKYLKYNFTSENTDYYTINYGFIKFIVLDNSVDLNQNSVQYKWLKNELTADFITPKIILINSLKKTKKSEINLDSLNLLFEKNNVKLVLSQNTDTNFNKNLGNVHYLSTKNLNLNNKKRTELKNKGNFFFAISYEGSEINIKILSYTLDLIDNIIIKN